GGFDPIAGAGDVIVIWNVLEHFWPYWDDVHRDWDRELDVVLAEALADRTADDHLATLRTLSAALPDGHATVRCPGTTPSAELPFDLEQIDGRIVVVASRDPRFEPGDVLGSIDGVEARDALTAAERLVSGSPQWRRVRALHHIGTGPRGSTARVRIERGAS